MALVPLGTQIRSVSLGEMLTAENSPILNRDSSWTYLVHPSLPPTLEIHHCQVPLSGRVGLSCQAVQEDLEEKGHVSQAWNLSPHAVHVKNGTFPGTPGVPKFTPDIPPHC